MLSFLCYGIYIYSSVTHSLVLLSFFDRQEQCNVLAELMREYQILKTSISCIIESTEPLVDISSVLKDHEETRRSLTKVRSSYDLSSGFCFAFMIEHHNFENVC